jgi:DNA polymerase I-like protein with 3'-5' exonuclease and polymerase domains
MSEKLIIIRQAEDIETLKDYISDKDIISFDTETNGTDKESKIIGFSISAETDIGFYVILSYFDNASQTLIDLPFKEQAKDFLYQLVNKRLIMHNAGFDCARVWDNFGIDLMPFVFVDTMELAHVLDEERHCGLKELGTLIFGETAKAEQNLMKESVIKNGGKLTKSHYELYKADADLIAKYGAKDTILTLKLFYYLIEQLYEQGLDKFFFEQESMPLIKGPTYSLNTTGLKVDTEKLQILKGTLETECMEAKAFIYKEITPTIKAEYPGTSKIKTFNVGSPKQLSWLLFIKLKNEFSTLTKEGRNLCKALELKVPYSPGAKREFIQYLIENKGKVYQDAEYNSKTKKMSRPKKIGEPWNYLASDKSTLIKYSKKYKWVEKLLEYSKNLKLLTTYVEGIQSRMKYGIIHPSFLQHGTTSGRYSSRNPNFQNLPRDDKRVKGCIVSRPGKVFVGADYSQLEPRVFASVSQDETLMKCFEEGKDFYSVVGIPLFGKEGHSAYKSDPNSFAVKFPELRDISKAFSLATPYGTSAFQQAQKLGKTKEECQDIIDKYFDTYPAVELMMLDSHKKAKDNGIVYSLYGRPRRLPEALSFDKIYGPNTSHGELPYIARNILNLAMNHRVQSSAATIVNRAMVAFHRKMSELGFSAKIVSQIHDEIIVECKESESEQIVEILQDCMESTTILPGVKLVAKPVIGKNLAELK